jgi:hypothetical protein
MEILGIWVSVTQPLEFTGHKWAVKLQYCKINETIFSFQFYLQMFNDEDGLSLFEADPHLSSRPENGLVRVVSCVTQHRFLARVKPKK